MKRGYTWAVILAGGSGERFWPKSRSSHPKQLLPIFGKKSLLQETVGRIVPKIGTDRILLVTNHILRKSVSKQLPKLKPKNIILEPCARNTAAAVGLAALRLKKQDPDAAMVVLPSDHVIKNKRLFLSIISSGIRLAKETGGLITLGLKPKFPSTGFGYIRLDRGLKALDKKSKKNIYRAAKFIEKPKEKDAHRFVRSGQYLWNGGIFIWRLESILQAFQKFMPRLHRGLKSLEKAQGKSNYGKELRRVYANLKSVPIDIGVLEKAKNVYTIAADLEWDDLGSWSSMEAHGTKDREGNVVIGTHQGIDTKSSIIVTDPSHLVGTIGVSDTVIVHAEDATLVCDKHRVQEVKALVRQLAKKKFRKYL